MKRVKFKDLKPGTHYWHLEDGELYPVSMTSIGGFLCYFMIGNECEVAPAKTDKFYEMEVPHIKGIDVFEGEFDGESIVDLDRAISECMDSSFNPIIAKIPEMKEFPGFWAGTFTVSVKWEPDDDSDA